MVALYWIWLDDTKFYCNFFLLVVRVSLAVGSQGNHKFRGRAAKENILAWRLRVAAKKTNLLGGWHFFLATWSFCRCPSFPASQTAKETILGSQALYSRWRWILLGGRLPRIIYLTVLAYFLMVFGCQCNSELW